MTIQEIIAHQYTPPKRYGKRFFDVLFSATILFLGLPIYVLIATLVKITSKGPIFYKGIRMGQNGHLITCWKFRTMCMDADKKLCDLLEKNPQLNNEWKIYHKLKNDPRLTSIGKFLRRTSLDEFPQFWNVLKGDLSIVGPRPIEIQNPLNAHEEIRSIYRNRTDKILSIKPGITCIWQTRGRNQLTLNRRADLEEEYVDTQSFLLDLRIILKTIYFLLIPKGAC